MRRTRILSLLLVLVMVLGLLPTALAAPVEAAAIYDLRVDDLVEPVGLDTNPTFSWKMRSDAIGAAQTAYRVVVTDGDSAMWDSQWQDSSASVGIEYAGEALSSSTEYDVTVTVKDQNGEEISAATTFETGLLEEDAWDDAAWISYDSAGSDVTSYTIDFDFILDRHSQGLCFGMQNTGTFVMWQVNAYEGIKTNGTNQVLLRPHFKKNGSWTDYPGKSGSNVKAVVLNDVLGCNAQELVGKVIHERIVVDGTSITTYFGADADNLVSAGTYTHTADIPLGKIGFRHCGGTEGPEIARYDNLVIRDGNGEVIYENDFSGEEILFSGSAAYISQTDGMLQVGNADLGSEQIYIQIEDSNLPAYRKSFTPAKELASAKLYTSGLGVYESYINGQRVGRLMDDGSVKYDELKPGFTEGDTRQFYHAYDVTWMLEAGENVLSSVVTSGWWTGDVAARTRGSETAYRAKLILNYADGTQEIINSDTSWKTACVSALQMADIFDGETYDARVDQSWMLPGYNDGYWNNAKVNTEFKGVLSAHYGSPIAVREDLEQKPVSVTVYNGVNNASDSQYGEIRVVAAYGDEAFTLSAGETAVVDFGQNFAGWEYFELEAASGTQITVKHGEMLNDNDGLKSRGNDGPEGSVYLENLRTAAATTNYIAAGSGVETYHPAFTYYGFRYISITATDTVTFHKVRGQVVTSVEVDTGFMETSDADVNQLVSNVRWGMYSNYLSTATDCPQRDERQGWTGDTQAFSLAGCYMGYSKSFLMKFMQDMRDGQSQSNGAFPSTAPSGDYNGGHNQGPLGWVDAGIIVPYHLYVMYGDVSVITENWDAMVLFMDKFMASTNGMGGTHNHGDWLAYESNDTEIKNMLGISYYAWDAMLMSEMAAAIGDTAAEAKYRQVYEDEKALFQSMFVLADGSLKRGEQSACLYALYLDLLPNAESVAKVTEQLISNIERNGNKLQTGFLGTAILNNALTKIGRTDVAYKLLLQHDNPSWLYSVDQGATTIWERWNSYTVASGFGPVSMNSFNHYAYGAVAGWMFRDMAGISYDTANPGFKHIILAPQPDRSLHTVNATYESVYGPIVSNMRYDEDAVWNYEATIPANTTATIYLPLEGDDCIVSVNGKAVDALTAADGVTYVETVDDTMVFEAVAGSFTFRSQRDPVELAKDVANAALEDLAPYQSALAITAANADDVRALVDAAVAAVEAFEAQGGKTAELTNYSYIAGAVTALENHEAFQIDTYTIDFDFTIVEEGTQGFSFGMAGTDTFVMWQVNGYRNRNSDKTILLRPHFMSNGKWTDYPGLSGSNVKAVDITEAVGHNTDTLAGSTVHERIEVDGNVIKTWFGPNAEDLTLADTYTHKTNVTLHNIGFRHSCSTTDGYEIATFDNIVIRDGEGNVIYSEDFSDPDAVEITGNTNARFASVADGQLTIGGREYVHDQVYILGKRASVEEDAAAVEALIDAIGTVTAESGEAIEAARAAYDALSDAQKTMVSNLAVLEAAELAYTTLTTDVTLVLTGSEEINVYDEEVTYTLSGKDMNNLATMLLTFEISDEYLTDPVAEATEGWYIIAQSWKDGKLNVALGNNAGVSGAGEILTVTLKPTNEIGSAVVSIAYAELGAYLGDGETFVEADLTEASVTTEVEHNIFDVNKDGVVNLLDLTRAQRYYGTDNADADVDRSGEVTLTDLILILNNYSDLFEG